MYDFSARDSTANDMSNMHKPWRKFLPKNEDEKIIQEYEDVFIDLGNDVECETDYGLASSDNEVPEQSTPQIGPSSLFHEQDTNSLLATQQGYQKSLQDSPVGILSEKEVVQYELLFDAESGSDDDFVPADLDEKYSIANKVKHAHTGEFEEELDPTIHFLKRKSKQLRLRVPSQQCSRAEREKATQVEKCVESKPSTTLEVLTEGKFIPTKCNGFELMVGMATIEYENPDLNLLIGRQSPAESRLDGSQDQNPTPKGSELTYTELLDLCGLDNEPNKDSNNNQTLSPEEESSSSDASSEAASQGFYYFDIDSQTDIPYTALNQLHRKDDVEPQPWINRDLPDSVEYDDDHPLLRQVREFAPGYSDVNDELQLPYHEQAWDPAYGHNDHDTALANDSIQDPSHAYNDMYHYTLGDTLADHFADSNPFSDENAIAVPTYESFHHDSSSPTSPFSDSFSSSSSQARTESKAQREHSRKYSQPRSSYSYSLRKSFPKLDPIEETEQDGGAFTLPASVSHGRGRRQGGGARVVRRARSELLRKKKDGDDDAIVRAGSLLREKGPSSMVSTVSADSIDFAGLQAGMVKPLLKRRSDFLDDEVDGERDGGEMESVGGVRDHAASEASIDFTGYQFGLVKQVWPRRMGFLDDE